MKMDAVSEKIKNLAEDLIRDRKTLVKVLSVMLILTIALVLRLYESTKADIRIEQETPEETVQEDDSYTDADYIYVDIGGAVEKPGVYRVAVNTRLYEVIEMAGGLTEEADADSVNRASFVEDGQKIIIPVKGSDGAAGDMTSPSYGTTNAGLININTASHDELTTLNGIGDVMADRIIEYRSTTPFRKKEDIMSVNGIGSGIYDKIKDKITC